MGLIRKNKSKAPPHTHHMHTCKLGVYAIKISQCSTKRLTVLFLVAAVQINGRSIAGNAERPFIK
jgi:hypothetical protein